MIRYSKMYTIPAALLKANLWPMHTCFVAEYILLTRIERSGRCPSRLRRPGAVPEVQALLAIHRLDEYPVRCVSKRTLFHRTEFLWNMLLFTMKQAPKGHLGWRATQGTSIRPGALLAKQ